MTLKFNEWVAVSHTRSFASLHSFRRDRATSFLEHKPSRESEAQSTTSSIYLS